MVMVDLVAEAEAHKTVDMAVAAVDILVAVVVDMQVVVGVTAVAADLITLEVLLLLKIIALLLVMLESDLQIYINDYSTNVIGC